MTSPSSGSSSQSGVEAPPRSSSAQAVGTVISLETIPALLHGQLVWSGQDMAEDDSSHIIDVGPVGVEEFVAGVQGYKAHELDGHLINSENFELPTLGAQLKQVAINLHAGTGFNVVRGIDPTKYGPEDLMTMFLGVASHVGNQRGVQNNAGDMIVHVTDAKWDCPYEQRHAIHTPAALPFHNDLGTEVLALQYRAVALDGGETSVASCYTIFNDMQAHHRDDLAVLMDNSWPIQTSNRPVRYILAPLMQFHDGNLVTGVDPGRLGRQPATANTCPRPNDTIIPELTTIQLKALDTLTSLAKKHAFTIVAEPGDILFINNLALLHSRNSYIDDEKMDTRRHLVRLWLRNSELGWDVPASMNKPWKRAFGKDEDRVGRYVPRRYSIVPMPVYTVPRYTAGSATFLVEDEDEVVV